MSKDKMRFNNYQSKLRTLPHWLSNSIFLNASIRYSFSVEGNTRLVSNCSHSQKMPEPLKFLKLAFRETDVIVIISFTQETPLVGSGVTEAIGHNTTLKGQWVSWDTEYFFLLLINTQFITPL